VHKSEDRICIINDGSFWYVEIIENRVDGILCNIIGFQNKDIYTIENNYFMRKTQFLHNYIPVVPDLEKEMIRIIYETK